MRALVCVVAALMLAPAAALAQTGKHVALGASIGVHEYTEERFGQGVSLSLLYRLAWNGTESNGWSWGPSATVGFSRANVQSDAGSDEAAMGKLQTIPALVGFGPHYRHGRVWAGASVTAGVSFNRFSVDQAAQADYENRFGVPLESVSAKNSFAVQPGVTVWYDVGSRLGLYSGVSYFYSRPKAEVRAGGVTTTETWNMDNVGLSMGAVVGVF